MFTHTHRRSLTPKEKSAFQNSTFLCHKKKTRQTPQSDLHITVLFADTTQTCFMCVFAPTRVLGATCESQELRPVHPGDGRLRGDLLAGAVTEHQEKKEKAKKCHRRLICNLSLCICFFSSSLLFPRLPFSLFATKGTHLCFSARRACRSVCLIASFLFPFFFLPPFHFSLPWLVFRVPTPNPRQTKYPPPVPVPVHPSRSRAHAQW